TPHPARLVEERAGWSSEGWGLGFLGFELEFGNRELCALRATLEGARHLPTEKRGRERRGLPPGRSWNDRRVSSLPVQTRALAEHDIGADAEHLARRDPGTY